MAAGMSRREPLFDPEAVFTLPATPSSQQIPLFADACAAGFPPSHSLRATRSFSARTA